MALVNYKDNKMKHIRDKCVKPSVETAVKTLQSLDQAATSQRFHSHVVGPLLCYKHLLMTVLSLHVLQSSHIRNTHSHMLRYVSFQTAT